MKIVITVDKNNEIGSAPLELSNDSMDNRHFIDLIIEEKVYTVEVDDLYQAVETYKRISDEAWERDTNGL